MVLLMNSHGWNDVFYNVNLPIMMTALCTLLQGMESVTVETVNAGMDETGNACEIWLGTEYPCDFVAGTQVRLSSRPSRTYKCRGNMYNHLLGQVNRLCMFFSF